MKTASVLTTWALTLFTHPAAAFDGTIGAGGIPSSNMSVEKWESYFKKPNATGTYTFDAYNVSGPFPPKETLGGWEATIAVANVTGDEDGPYPGTSISIKAPEDVKLPALNSSRSNESDWHVCVAFWSPDVLEDDALDDGQDDDGSCSSFLSDDCIEAIKGQANGFLYWDNEEKKCGSSPMVPKACEDYFSDDVTTVGFTCKFPVFDIVMWQRLIPSKVGANLSSLDGSPLISERPDLTGPEAVDQDEAYENAVRGIWTVMINWGRRDPQSWSTGDDEMPQASLLCLRASNVTAGSENPNAGARLGLDGTFALFIALFASTFLIY
ncbi:hypothetical protein FALBO_15183 [Fusarium albosuccineum]|uniref:Uncharacterized protein n=1 Tax=Fusarium albosuccineum TaxID=1237068 RepID=A0A8H4KWN7_9HYPO|nr:hypothetical protein FALBO_15183 [Fusarium albosuccineum]